MTEETKMTLAEALKTVKLNMKKIGKIEAEINKYSSKLSNEVSPFGDDKAQKKKVMSLVQKGEDLIRNTLKMKSRIEKTNAMTEVSVAGEKYTISELLFMKRKARFNGSGLYNNLDTREGDTRIRFLNNEGNNVTVDRMYKEEDRINGLKKWEEIRDYIEVKLETLNNMTYLMD